MVSWGRALGAALAGWVTAVGMTASPASAAVTERSVYYSYDLAGRQLTAKFDSATGADGITNSYNGFGDLKTSQISMGGFSKTLTSGYDAGGRRNLLTHPDNSKFSYCYDALSRLSSVYQGATCASTPLESFTYGSNGSSRTEATARERAR